MFSQSEHTYTQHELTFRLSGSPTVQERVLALLLDSDGEELAEADVREALDLPRASAHVALRGLAEQGLTRERRVGRTVLYRLDSDDALIRPLKIARAIRRAQIAMAPVRESVDLAILYGSASRGEDRRGSDIDMLVVADDSDAVLSELARHQWLQPVVMTSAEHMRLIADGGTFAGDVSRGIMIWQRR